MSGMCREANLSPDNLEMVNCHLGSMSKDGLSVFVPLAKGLRWAGSVVPFFILKSVGIQGRSGANLAFPVT